MMQTSSSLADERGQQFQGVANATGRERLAPLLPAGEPVEALLRKAQIFAAGAPSGNYRELQTLRERGDGYLPDRFLTAVDLGSDVERANHQTVLLEAATGEPVLADARSRRATPTRAWAGGTSVS